jgi:hypothetical protein
MLLDSIIVNELDHFMVVAFSKVNKEIAANSELLPFSLKKTTLGGFSLAYLNISSP